MCGLHAINHILRALKLTEVTAAEIHALSREMAQRECSLIYAQDATMVLDLEVDPRGNYPVDVLIWLLQSRTGHTLSRWSPNTPVLSTILLIGSGVHWQAVLREDGLWFLYEQSHRNAVPDLPLLLEGKVLNGAVYQVGEIQDLPKAVREERLSDRVRAAEATSPSSTPPPPSKRPKQSIRVDAWNMGVASLSETRAKRRLLSHDPSEHKAMELPEEFMLNPQFTFDPPQILNTLPREPMDDLLEIMTEDVEDSDSEPRPQRCRPRTRLYQADEEAKMEKEKREVARNTEEKTRKE